MSTRSWGDLSFSKRSAAVGVAPELMRCQTAKCACMCENGGRVSIRRPQCSTPRLLTHCSPQPCTSPHDPFALRRTHPPTSSDPLALDFIRKHLPRLNKALYHHLCPTLLDRPPRLGVAFCAPPLHEELVLLPQVLEEDPIQSLGDGKVEESVASRWVRGRGATEGVELGEEGG